MASLIPTLLFSLASFLDLSGLTLLLGASWLHISCLPSGNGEKGYSASVFQRLWRLYLLCMLILAVGSVGILLLRSMEMSGAGFQEVWSVLPTVLLKTQFGTMWLLKSAALLSAGFIWYGSRRHCASRVLGLALFGLAALMAFSRSSSGHLGDFGIFSNQQLNDWLHLLAVSCWAGAIIAVFVLYPVTGAENGMEHESIGPLADRFYILFGPLLAILVFTGWRNSWLLVRDFPALAGSPYGWLLSVKLLLVTVLVARYITLPGPNKNNRLYISNFLRRIRIDTFLVISILLCVSFLIHRVPARHQAHLAYLAAGGGHADEHIYSDMGDETPVVNLMTNPLEIRAGIPVRISLNIKEKDGSPARNLTIIHDRILHAIIIGRDLAVFAHIHPEDLGPITLKMLEEATFPLIYTFPKAGKYLLGVDFAQGEEAYSRTFRLDVANPATMQQPVLDFSSQKTFEGYQVSLDLPDHTATAGIETTLRYVIRRDGEELKDLEPYLGAAMHLAVVSADLKTFVHSHGVVPGTGGHADHLHIVTPAHFGPEIDAGIIFPAPGVYKIFGQFQHGSQVILTEFMVTVKE